MSAWGDVLKIVPPDRRLAPNRVQNAWVAVDACLVDAVRELWRFGYVTTGACCGHGRGAGEIVVIGQLEAAP